MNTQKKIETTGIVLIGALAIYLMYQHHLKQTALNSNPTPDNVEGMLDGVGNGFTAPYYSTVPGITDVPYILNGGAPFNSVINVNVNPNIAQFLSHDYIPLFGFIGIAAYGDAPNYNQLPPSQVIYPPPIMPSMFTSPVSTRPNIGVSTTVFH